MAREKFERTLPHVNVGTVGHVDHGKTTLTWGNVLSYFSLAISCLSLFVKLTLKFTYKMELITGLEPVTSYLPSKCSTAELYEPVHVHPIFGGVLSL